MATRRLDLIADRNVAREVGAVGYDERSHAPWFRGGPPAIYKWEAKVVALFFTSQIRSLRNLPSSNEVLAISESAKWPVRQ